MAEVVLDYARKHNVTKIIAGKPVRPRWHELIRGAVVDQIIRTSGPIDVYVISGAPDAKRSVPIETAGVATAPPLAALPAKLAPCWRRYVAERSWCVPSFLRPTWS